VNDIRTLLEPAAEPAVSIYMPVAGIAPDPYKLGTHLKSLLRQVEEDTKRQEPPPLRRVK